MSNASKAERTRGELLDAAWDLICRQGAQVSMADIAAAAGVTRQSVYVHFRTRGGLLTALVRRADERFAIREAFAEAMGRPDPVQRLDACLSTWLDFVPQIHPVARELIRLRATDRDADAAWADRMDELCAFFLDLVKSIEAEGALAPCWTAQTAADFMWANVSVQVWGLLVEERGWRPQDAAQAIRRSIPMVLLK